MDTRPIGDLTSNELFALLKHIGNTPLQPLSLIIGDRVHITYLKLEGANPGRSIKIRTAYSLVRDLEDRALLSEDSIIVESTSGNLGVALSMIAKAKGYRFLAVVDPKTTPENIDTMRLLGAQIEMVEQLDRNGSYLLTRLEHIHRLCQSSSKYIWSNQYENTANPHIHYTQTGPEIYRQMHGEVDAIFVAVSTGGTLAGISRYFREVSPRTRIIGVDARGSVIFGAPPAPRKLTGIGSSRTSSFFQPEHYDAYCIVDDEEAFAFCRKLHDETALKVGGSSGAVLAACTQYLKEHLEIQRSVCLCPDTGENYTSSIFSDEWLSQQHLDVKTCCTPSLRLSNQSDLRRV